MNNRALSSGISLNRDDAAIVKGMLRRGDRQHDIAAWFGVNGGRIAEIAACQTFRDVEAALSHHLPPPGPYLSGRSAEILVDTLAQARMALIAAEALIRGRSANK